MPFISHKTIRREKGLVNRSELAALLSFSGPEGISYWIDKGRIMPPDYKLGRYGAWTPEQVAEIKREFNVA